MTRFGSFLCVAALASAAIPTLAEASLSCMEVEAMSDPSCLFGDPDCVTVETIDCWEEDFDAEPEFYFVIAGPGQQPSRRTRQSQRDIRRRADFEPGRPGQVLSDPGHLKDMQDWFEDNESQIPTYNVDLTEVDVGFSQDEVKNEEIEKWVTELRPDKDGDPLQWPDDKDGPPKGVIVDIPQGDGTVKPTLVLIDGHHRYEAAVELGATEIPIRLYHPDTARRLGAPTPEDVVKRYREEMERVDDFTPLEDR